MQNSLLTLVSAIWHRAQRTKACSEVRAFTTFRFTESLFLVPAHIILPLFLRCQGFPCLQRLPGQEEDSHMLFTAGLEAPPVSTMSSPLGILFDLSIPLRLLKP